MTPASTGESTLHYGVMRACALVVGAALFVASSPSSRAEEPRGAWGAVAVSAGTGVPGRAWGMASEQEAKNAAMRQCMQGAGQPTDCEIAGTVYDGCVALATSASDAAFGFSGRYPQPARAREEAMRRCDAARGASCAIASTFCSPGGEVRPDSFGSLAVSKSTLAAGGGWSHATRFESNREAIKACAKGGATDCDIVFVIVNACIAVATSAPEKLVKVGTPYAALKTTMTDALSQCQAAGGKACVVAASGCADGAKRP